MPFISEDVEQAIIKEFARVVGVKPDQVDVEVADRAEEQGIKLKAHSEMKDFARDTELYIRMTGRNEFQMTGTIQDVGKATRKRDINQAYKGYPQSLPKAMARVLSMVKIKKSYW